MNKHRTLLDDVASPFWWFFLIAATFFLVSGETYSQGSERNETPAVREGKNYLIVPVQTDLQRHYFRDYENVIAYVFVNAMDPINEDATVLDVSKIDFDGLEASLLSLAKSHPTGCVIFAVRARSKPQRLPAAGLLSRALLQLAREVGLAGAEVDFKRFSDSSHGRSKYFNNWKSLVTDLTRPATKKEVDAESVHGDEKIKVFEVRTPLSRQLFGGHYEITADCAIFAIPPIEDLDTDELLVTVEDVLPDLNLKNKGRVLLHIHINDLSSDEARTAFASLQGPEYLNNPVWQDILGFRIPILGFWNLPPSQAAAAYREKNRSSSSKTQ